MSKPNELDTAIRFLAAKVGQAKGKDREKIASSLAYLCQVEEEPDEPIGFKADDSCEEED